MHAKERIGWVGNGIQQPVDKVRLVGSQLEIVTVERNNCRIGIGTGFFGDAIGLQSATNDDVIKRTSASPRLNDVLAAALCHTSDPVSETKLTTAEDDIIEQTSCDARIVDYRCTWRVHRRNPHTIGFDLTDAFGIDDFNSRHAICPSTFSNVIQPLKLVGAMRNNQLAAGLIGHTTSLTIFVQKFDAPASESSFQTSWLVIQSSMHDAAIVPGLMCCGTLLFFKNRNRVPAFSE